jgi:hypothetical protein
MGKRKKTNDAAAVKDARSGKEAEGEAGSSRAEDVQNGRFDTRSQGIDRTLVGQSEARAGEAESEREGASRSGARAQDEERPAKGRDAGSDEEVGRTPVETGSSSRGEER